MNAGLMGIAILLAALVVWLVLQNLRSQKKGDGLENQLGELRRDLQTIATSQAQSAGQIQTMGQTVAQRLESVTSALQSGVKLSGPLKKSWMPAFSRSGKRRIAAVRIGSK